MTWLTYLKKDWRMMRSEYFLAIALVVIVEIIGYILVAKNIIDIKIQVFLSLGIVALFMPIHLAVSLSKERINAASVWLSIPSSGIQLYSSKLVAAFLGLCSITVLSVVSSMIARTVFGSPAHLLSLKLVWCFYLLQFGIAVGVLVVFVSALMTSFNHYLPEKRGFLAILLFCMMFSGILYLVTTDFYSVFSWGSISIPALFQIPAAEIPEELHTIYFGEQLLDICINIAMFLVAVWLFDKKVEV